MLYEKLIGLFAINYVLRFNFRFLFQFTSHAALPTVPLRQDMPRVNGRTRPIERQVTNNDEVHNSNSDALTSIMRIGFNGFQLMRYVPTLK